MYWAPVLLVVTALRQQRRAGWTVRRLEALFGVTRPTLTRWMRYFREEFPQSRVWQRLCGRLMPPLAPQALPAALLGRFALSRDSPEAVVSACLQALLLPDP